MASIFEDAGFTLPTAKPKADDAAPAASSSKAAPKSIFEAAGFEIPTAGKSAAPARTDSDYPTPEAFEAGWKAQGSQNPPTKSILQKVNDVVDLPAKLLAKGSELAAADIIEHAAAGWQAAKQGLAEIREGNLWPSQTGVQAPGHVTNLAGETSEVPGLPQYAPGGLLRAAGGALSAVASPVSGSVNALVARPVTELTGNPDIGERAGFVVNALVPVRAAAPFTSTAGRAAVAENVAGKVATVERAGNALKEVAAEKAAPATASVNALVKMVGPENVPEAVARLRENPRLSLVDVSDPVRTATQGMVDAGQPKAQSLISTTVRQRAADRGDVANSAFTELMGPKPDMATMVEGLKRRAEGEGAQLEGARSALNEIMGQSSDPYEVLQQTLKRRSEEAQPLYEKAFRGGSVAPLQNQFESAFSDAANTVADATKELAAARQQQLLAKAELSRAGDNVYANNSALSAGREADAAVAEAEQKLESAQNNKESITGRLRQAQQDGAMNMPGAVWNPRIQQFLDDPIAQAGLAKGERIQRLEALAEGKSYNPKEYAITGHDENGHPIIGSVPNMRTLNVVKKGLDRMVEDAKDPVTGRLSEEGRAIDKVRSSFLTELDKANSDYKAARQAWAGPSQAQDAYNRGLNLFQNKSGSSGVNSTPEALASWFNKASQAEQDAARIGARAAFEQQMKSASDPAARGAALVNKEVNRDKLVVLFGKEQADKLAKQMNFKFEDPIGRAFDEGFDVLKNRSGVNGLNDRPEALAEWIQKASPEQIVAKRLGVRADIDQKLNGVKNGGLAGETVTKIPYNQEKLRILFGEKEANRLIRVMKDASDQAETNSRLIKETKTFESFAGNRALKVPEVEPFHLGTMTQALLPSALADVASQYMGAPFGLAGAGLLASGTIAGGLKKGVQTFNKKMALERNYQFAKNALATGPAREETINALLSHPKVIGELKKRSNALVAP